MSIDVAGWLRNLGLGQYETAFRENAVDETVLSGLTADDLKDLGVELVGHRRRLLDAIAALRPELPIAPGSAPEQRYAQPRPEAERRQLTVMFCDLVGSTALAARLDPEDLREVIGAYHRAIADTIAPFDGFVAKYLGDGALVYFGYPAAHEDDAERAVRAGLALLMATTMLDVAGEKLRLRIGIATGLAVVGDLIGTGAAREEAVVGETPNLAARLQALAEPGTMLIADGTRRLLGSLFNLIDLGAQELRGIAQKERVWRVIGASGVESRFDALRSGETPLVGRQEELHFLMRRWSQAQAGEGRVVLLSGEPGIGKSRLAAAVQERLAGERHTRIRYFCSPHHQASALHPFISQLERAANFERDDPSEERLRKLAALLQPAAADADVALIAELLSLPTGDGYPRLELSPQRKKERTFETLLRQLEDVVRRQPLLMIFEDVHWIDPTSREMLDLIVARVESLPVLLLVTFRPEFDPPWADQPSVTLLVLNRLGRRDGLTLVQRLAGKGDALPQDLLDEIVVRTDGVPLFLEEMTKAVLEIGPFVVPGVPASALAIPATLHASLMARLDRLGPVAKAIAQLGAAIGREFSYALLQSVAALPEPELRSALDLLADAGIVVRRGLPPSSTYLFKHALVQDTAYGTLLRGPRQTLHLRIARALEERFAATAEVQPEILAHHFAVAGVAEKSATYRLRAGRFAAARFANLEAISHLQRGIEAVRELPEGASKDKLELDLQFALGPCLIARLGPVSEEATTTFARARELCSRLGDAAEYPQVMHWLTVMHAQRGELPQALDAATAAVGLAEARGDRPAMVNATRGQGLVLLMLGRPLEARRVIERNAAEFEACSEAEKAAMLAAGQDAGAAGLAVMAWVLWALGYPDLAAARIAAALRRAAATRHPHTQAYSWYYASVLHALRREPEVAHRHADRCLALSEEHGFAHWRALSSTVRAICATLRDAADDSLATASRELADHAGGSYSLGITALYALLSEALAVRGDPAAASQTIAQGLAIADRTGERMFEAELLRLQACALLADGGAATAAHAEAVLEMGLEVSRAQQARSFELRAACDLARLWAARGERGRAAALLGPVCQWFTEGLGSADLGKAKTLLDDLW